MWTAASPFELPHSSTKQFIQQTERFTIIFTEDVPCRFHTLFTNSTAVSTAKQSSQTTIMSRHHANSPRNIEQLPVLALYILYCFFLLFNMIKYPICAMHSWNRLTMKEEETMSGNLICKTAMLIWHDVHLNNVAVKNVFEMLIKLLRLIRQIQFDWNHIELT